MSEAGIFDAGLVAATGPVVRNLGFSLITDVDLADPSATELAVALRPEPTLRHFDPEVVAFWGVDAGRGRRRQIDRSSRRPLTERFLWGRIEIADRLGMTNQWLAFGGLVQAEDLDPETLVVAFTSPAPIQRWSGHSQGLDPLTSAMGAFFARLMVPIDFEPGAEARIAGLDPRALYCAFLADRRARTGRSVQFAAPERGLQTFVEREAHRLEAGDPRAWASGTALVADLGLGG